MLQLKPLSAEVSRRAKEAPLAPRVLLRKRLGMPVLSVSVHDYCRLLKLKPVLSVSVHDYCRLLKLKHELELALEGKENATRRGTY